MRSIDSDRLLNQTWSIRTITPFDEPWNLNDLEAVSSLVTSYIRDFVKNLDKVELDGSNVTLSWIHLDNSKFLFLDMYLADEMKAQVVLCFPLVGTADNLVEAFEFALLHGDSKWYQILLDWLGKTKQCWFPKHNIRLVSENIEQLLTGSLQFVDPEAAKLEVTLATPPVVKNLDTISITIPPHALHSLFLEIQECQASKSLDLSSTSHPSTSLSQTLRLFILQEFGIDVTTFQLIQVSNHVAIFDANGKIRINEKERINDILLLLNHIVKQIIAPLKEGSATKNESKTPSNSSRTNNPKNSKQNNFIQNEGASRSAILEHITDTVETNFVSI